MKIIKLSPDRWEDYKNLRLRALKEDSQAFGASYEENVKYPKEEWERRLKNGLEGKVNWLLFAEDSNKLVGIIGAFMEENATDTVKIYSMYVPKEERGKGIASKLIEGMLKELSGNSRLIKVQLEVNKDQIPAVNLYKKFGFKEIKRKPYVMGDGTQTEELVMERGLPYK